MTPDRYLVAPDSYKGTFGASEVGEAIGRGIARGGGEASLCPVADGGEGTAEILLGQLGGSWRRREATGPLGDRVAARFALLGDGQTAAIDTAAASGLSLIEPESRDAEAATTRGTGELIAAAIADGARRVLLGAGGSATTDGGAGAVDAINAAGGLRGAEIVVLCDTELPFERAAEVFAPQKGADADAVERLTDRLSLLAEGLPRSPRGLPYGGCAGGLSGALWAAFDAELRPGAAFVLDLLGFEEQLEIADAVVTGEGRLDDQSLTGKVVGEIARRCRAAGTLVHVIVGSSEISEAGESELGAASIAVASELDEIESAAQALAAGV